MAARYRDHNALVGNLHPGQPALAEPVVEVIAGRSYTYEEELARIRAHTNNHLNAAPAYRPAPYRHRRSLRRA